MFPATSPLSPQLSSAPSPNLPTTVPSKPSFPPGWNNSSNKTGRVLGEEVESKDYSWYPGEGGQGRQVTADSFANWWQARRWKVRGVPPSNRPCLPHKPTISTWGDYRREKRRREEEARVRRRSKVEDRERRRRAKEEARVEKEWVRRGEDVPISRTPTTSPRAARKYRSIMNRMPKKRGSA